jgi:hypothetical protein
LLHPSKFKHQLHFVSPFIHRSAIVDLVSTVQSIIIAEFDKIVLITVKFKYHPPFLKMKHAPFLR